MNNLVKAIEMASEGHKNQTRWDGSPYILHPIRVMMTVAKRYNYDENVMIVAVLHDIIEDTDMKIETLQKLFPADVCCAVFLLSKIKGEDYKEYIVGLSTCQMARRVKLADLEDNSNIVAQRGTNASDEKIAKRFNRYLWAHNLLSESEYN